MDSFNATSLFSFLGVAVGTLLYVILLAIIVRHPDRSGESGVRRQVNFLLLTTAVLGILWNGINLIEFVWRDFLSQPLPAYFTATAFAAFGFLPAVVVNSEWRAADRADANVRRLTVAAYCLSVLAAGLHFYDAFFFNFAPSAEALWILTVGYSLILVALFVLTRRSSLEHKTVWATALAIFAVSVLHLSRQPNDENNFWFVELIAHQASLPIVFVILHQNFRFAFADLFLKRALSLILLATLVGAAYFAVAVPLLALHDHHQQPDIEQIGINLILWMAVAVLYPPLHRLAVWTVDRLLLRRVDYAEFKREIARQLAARETAEATLELVKDKLSIVLTAKKSSFGETPHDSFAANSALVKFTKDETEVLIPTADQPQYKIHLRDFSGGRQLLSEEIEMLEEIALQTARRIDVVRVSHERCERELREREFSNLTVEAELRALRAQINPHFLFNALTTVGYLINAAPEKALQTLLKLTELLRGILRSSGEFQTLGEELKIIRAYLEIEQARFEERLRIEIDVPDALLPLKIPSLILQPLVENAVKHGISPKKDGGKISLTARRDAESYVLQVRDTGIGINRANFSEKRLSRVGLNNIEQRLNLYFDGAASLSVTGAIDGGTTVEIRLNALILESHQRDRPKAKVEQSARVSI
ncbi:MAG: histidine kinase [Acidobacteriota bacterium]|nr:histidine kinase [Acidobacteriota bacterium]